MGTMMYPKKGGHTLDFTQFILLLVLSLFFGVFVVKLGIDNSQTHKLTKEMLEELREIKELLREHPPHPPHH